MLIQNIHHKGKYTVARQDWDEMGAAQKSFRILEHNDAVEGQTISNQAGAILKPPAEDGKNTNTHRTNTSKNKKS